jgi:hypothetical protein
MCQQNTTGTRPVVMQHTYVCALSVIHPAYVCDETVMQPAYAF